MKQGDMMILKSWINSHLSELEHDYSSNGVQSLSVAEKEYLQALQYLSLAQHQPTDAVAQHDHYRNAQWCLIRAASRGHIEAAYLIGRYYLEQSEQDDEQLGEAQKWLKQAALRGHRHAAQLLKQTPCPQ